MHSHQPRARARWLSTLVVPAIAGAIHACPVQAQDATIPDVQVTASPIIQNVVIDPFSGSSARIGEDQIRDQNSIDLPSAIRNTPGTEISRFNPVGSYAGDQGGRVFIHGLGSGAPGAEIQTYVDGIPIYSPVWGHPLLDTLPINGISSIDIYKGPRPWVNGDNWGSINLTTALPSQDGLHGDGQLSGGMFGTVVQQGNLYGKFGAVDFSLSESFARSDGARSNAQGQIANAMGRLGFQLDEHWRADLRFLYVDSVAYDPQSTSAPYVPIAPHYDTRLGMIAGALSHDYGTFKGEMKLYFTDADSHWRNTTYALAPQLSNVYNAEYKFQTMGARWHEEVSPWINGTVAFGIDYDQISGHNTTEAPFPTPVNVGSPVFQMTSPYVSVRQDIPLNDVWKLVPSAGIRVYAHNVFPTETAPHAGLSLVSDKLTAYASYARGVHYPGLEVFEFSRLYPFFGTTWRNLSAERDEHGEIGFKAKPFDGTRVDVSLFSDWVSKRYDFNFASGQDINFGSYRSQGMELAVRQAIGPNWSVFAGWTILTASEGNLPFMPHDTVTLGVNGSIGPVRLAVDAQYRTWIWGLTDFRVPGGAMETKVDPFLVTNARLSYPVPALGQKGEVFMAIENLFDRRFSYTPGYPQPGIWAQVGVKASF